MNDQTLPKPTAPTSNSGANNNLPQVLPTVPKPAVPDQNAKPAYKPTTFPSDKPAGLPPLPKLPNLPQTPNIVQASNANPVVNKVPTAPTVTMAPAKPVAPAGTPPVAAKAPVAPMASTMPAMPTMPAKPTMPPMPNLPKPPVMAKAPTPVQPQTKPNPQMKAQDVPLMDNKPAGLPPLPKLPNLPQAPNIAQATNASPVGNKAPISPTTPMAPAQQMPPIAPAVTAGVQPVAAKAPVAPMASTMPAMPAKPAMTPMPNLPKPPVASPVNNATQPTAPQTQPIAQAPSASTNPPSAQPTTQTATPSRSFMSYLPFVLGGFLIVGILAFFGLRFFSASNSVSVSENTSQTGGTTNTGNTANSGSNANAGRTEVPATQTTITYWGLFESNDLMQTVIKDFESKNPAIKVNYVQQSYRDYRERLGTAITGGTGPDLFRFHASWVPMLKNGLSPIPSSVITAKDMKDNFYPAVSEQLLSGGQYVGVPMMYDGLALYYNEDILKAANETIPDTWMDLQKLAQKLTIRSANGVERGGLAIGNASNVEHYPEILALLMMQNGADLTKPNTPQVRDALLYYTSFMTKDPVWSEKLPSSTVAFARGEVAMMFAPSWRAHEIQALNPDLKFGVAKLPQLSEDKVAYATYWAEGLNPNSKNKDAAAKFLAHLVNDETLKTFYSEASKVRGFGELYPKVSMASLLSENKVAVPILEDAVYAKSWYLNSYTHDNGLNDQLIGYYKVAIESFAKSSDTETALSTLEKGVTQVLKQYGLVK